MDNFFFDYIFPVLLGIGMILWFYCIWFLNKYDKNTNRLVMLLFLNIYYVPFYLFRIRRIKKENRIKALSEEIYDSDFIEMSRNSIIETLDLWASKEKQLKFDKADNETNFTKELFQQWETVYRIDNKIIGEAFNSLETELLITFDKSITISDEKFRNDFPDINEFQNTNDWKVLNQLAIEITKEIKKTLSESRPDNMYQQ
ncbi:MAG TPA: hypothetical protein VK212_08100 [Lentimicrobium sp.]|nr:hypothetical protein [Lentimicrobium sp.]